ANAGAPYGIAKAYATAITGLDLYAGNAYGGAAYGGTGSIAAGGSIEGVAGAYSYGYKTVSKAFGLQNIRATAGNTVGAYYGNSTNTTYTEGFGKGTIGQFIGTALAKATSYKAAGSVSSYALAYGIENIQAYA